MRPDSQGKFTSKLLQQELNPRYIISGVSISAEEYAGRRKNLDYGRKLRTFSDAHFNTLALTKFNINDISLDNGQ